MEVRFKIGEYRVFVAKTKGMYRGVLRGDAREVGEYEIAVIISLWRV